MSTVDDTTLTAPYDTVVLETTEQLESPAEVAEEVACEENASCCSTELHVQEQNEEVDPSEAMKDVLCEEKVVKDVEVVAGELGCLSMTTPQHHEPAVPTPDVLSVPVPMDDFPAAQTVEELVLPVGADHIDDADAETVEILTPELQRAAARLAKQKDTDAPATDTNSKNDTIPEVVTEVLRKKKPTSTERRALRDAKHAAAAESTETDNTAPMGEEAPTKARKMNSKQRKAHAKRLAAATAAEQTDGAAVSTESHTTAVIALPEATPKTTVESVSDKPKSKKLGSRERRAKRDAKIAELAANTNGLPVAAVEPSPAPTGGAGEAAQEGNKAKKLSSKQRKARARALEAATTAAGEPSVAHTASAEQPNKTAPTNNKQKPTDGPAVAPSTGTTTNTTAAVLTLPVNQLAGTGSTKTTPSVRPLDANQTIALHATLTALRQGLLSRDSVIYTQQAALKMYLLAEVCKLGHECLEGTANSFQHISWSGANQCLTYTNAIVNTPQEYAAAIRPKGDLKISAPALSVQLKCYPAFGKGSPALLGKKAFRAGFVRHFKEVVEGETHAFVFVLPLEVYEQYAREALSSLPAAQDIKRHYTASRLVYTSSDDESTPLKAEFCCVETGYGEFVIGSAVVAATRNTKR